MKNIINYLKSEPLLILVLIIIFGITISTIPNERTQEEIESDKKYKEHGRHNVVCIKGVKYLSSRYSLTPLIDSKTLNFTRCDND